MSNLSKMPALFLGHGSPMNALADNVFTQRLLNLGTRISRPKAILCISAHWLTRGTWVTGMPQPKTIHDFYGFPKELFEVQYPAPGSVSLAQQIQSKVLNPSVSMDDHEWGLDHGTWSVLKFLYPEANIPVVQLSIDLHQSPEYHFKIGKQLRALREEGILIVGSGNIVHNLRQIQWDESAAPYEWAVQFDEWAKQCLEKRDFQSLVKDYLKAPGGALSVPTPDHYDPLLYILGSADESEPMTFEFDGFQNASISMRAIRFG
jgi:4,5-DOPA dioxygenase extradiol